MKQSYHKNNETTVEKNSMDKEVANTDELSFAHKY